MAQKLYYNESSYLKKENLKCQSNVQFQVNLCGYCSPESRHFAASEMGANAALLKQGVNLARKSLCEHGNPKILGDFSEKQHNFGLRSVSLLSQQSGIYGNLVSAGLW